MWIVHEWNWKTRHSNLRLVFQFLRQTRWSLWIAVFLIALPIRHFSMVNCVLGSTWHHCTTILWWKGIALSCRAKQTRAKLAFPGKSKDSLDRIQLPLPLDAVISTFSPFLHYYTSNRFQQSPPVVKDFTVMMSNLKQQLQPRLPGSITVCTQKDELHNDILEMLEEENLLFPGAEINTSGKNFVITMVECM